MHSEQLRQLVAEFRRVTVAREWLADIGFRPAGWPRERVVQSVAHLYPGGWGVFVADCCPEF